MYLILASVAYLVLAHAAALTGSDTLGIAAVVLLIILTLAMLRGMPWLQGALLLAAGACVLFADAPVQTLMYAPPVLFPLLLAALFGRSLAAGRQPFVERIVWHLHGQPATLSDAHRRYARGVTFYWCVIFVAMAVLNLALACFAPLNVWSWVGNIASYTVPIVAMLAEYAWRKRVFPVQPYRNLFDYLVKIIRLGPTLAQDMGHDWRSDESDRTTASGY